MKIFRMDSDNHPELRLVGDSPGERDPAGAKDEERDQGDLVAEVIGEAGLLRPDQVEQARSRAGVGAFSQALVDEGFASALGVARTLAEQYHLPLVDLAVAGVDAQASKLISLPVLERVCAIPFAADGSTIKVAITDPGNVRGLDELRLATRQSVEFFVARVLVPLVAGFSDQAKIWVVVVIHAEFLHYSMPR